MFNNELHVGKHMPLRHDPHSLRSYTFSFYDVFVRGLLSSDGQISLFLAGYLL